MAGTRKPTGPDREGHERDGHDHVPGDADFPHLHGPPPPPEPGDPGPGIRELLKGKSGLYLPERPAKVTVERARNPAPRGSFGYVDRFVTVRGSRGEFPRGKLVVAVDHKGLGTVDPETLRVFRWDQTEKAFQAIFRSAPGQTRDYVWADLSEPGSTASSASTPILSSLGRSACSATWRAAHARPRTEPPAPHL